MGSTVMPCLVIRKGYSLVPWVEPRYLTMRSRRVANLIGDAMVEQDHAIGDVLFQAVAGRSCRRPVRR